MWRLLPPIIEYWTKVNNGILVAMRQWGIRTCSKESFVLTAYDAISLESRRPSCSRIDCWLIKTRIIAITLYRLIDFSLPRISTVI